MKKFLLMIILVFMVLCVNAASWKAETGKVRLTEDKKNKLLKIEFSAGHKGSVLLRPEEKIVLAPTALRIHADVLGKPLKMSVLITGNDGKEREFPIELIRGYVWSEAVSDYIGGERKELNSMRPEFPHPRGEALPARLTGLRITPRDKNPIRIGNIRASNIEYLKHRRWELTRLPDFKSEMRGLRPFGPDELKFRLDWLLPAKKKYYTVQWRLSDHWQGAPYASGKWEGEWDPSNLKRTKEEGFLIPLSGNGTYYLTVKYRDRAGKLLERNEFAIAVIRDGKVHVPSTAASRFGKNPYGLLALDTGHADNIYPDLSNTKLKVFSREKIKNGTLKVTIDDLSLAKRGRPDKVINKPWKPDASGAQVIDLKLPEDGAAYEVTASLLADGKTIDREPLRVGVRKTYKPEKLKIRQPEVTDLFGNGKVVLNICDLADMFGTYHIPATLSFPEFYKEAIQAWQKCQGGIIRLTMPFREIEPLPGFFDSRSIDLRTKMLREAGLPYMFNLPHPFDSHRPLWTPMNPQENYMGLSWTRKNRPRQYYQTPAMTPVYIRKIIRHFYDRYKNDPQFKGWVLWSDRFYGDPVRSDFSPMVAKEFVTFLREQKRIHNVDELTKRYGCKINSWEDVGIPMPPLEALTKYTGKNSRNAPESCKDLIEFKAWFVKHVQNDLIARFTRKLGETRAIAFYAYPTVNIEYYLEDLLSLGSFVTIGREGSVYADNIRNQSLPPYYLNYAFLNEYTGHVPGCERGHIWRIDMVERGSDRILASHMVAGGKDLNFAMLYPGPRSPGVNYSKVNERWLSPAKRKKRVEARQKVINAGLDRQTAWIKTLRKGFVFSDIIPWENGVISAGTNGGSSGGSGISQFLWPRYPHHLLKKYSPDSAFSAQKIIWIPETTGTFDYDSDFSPRMQNKVLRYVRNGGKVVFVSPDSARYTYGKSKEQFVLLKKLGWSDIGGISSNANGKHHYNAVPVKNSIFRQAKSIKMTGSLSHRRIKLPKKAIVEARFANGQPAVVRWKYGKGEVVLFLYRYNSNKRENTPEAIADLMNWAGARISVKTAPPVYFALTKHDKHNKEHYLMLYHQIKGGCDVKVNIMSLPKGRYRVEDIGPGDKEQFTASAKKLKKGVVLHVPLGMRLLKLTPVD